MTNFNQKISSNIVWFHKKSILLSWKINANSEGKGEGERGGGGGGSVRERGGLKAKVFV